MVHKYSWILYVIVLTIISPKSIAQKWFPLGAQWVWGANVPYSPKLVYANMTCSAEVLIDGISCKEISFSGPYHNYKEYVYEKDNVVYYYVSKGKFIVLYDFNKLPGEFWLDEADSCINIIHVDSTGYDTINGIPLKTLYVSTDNIKYPFKIIQYIGYIGTPFPNFSPDCYSVQNDNSMVFGLRCYTDRFIGFHDFKIAPTCRWTYYTHTEQQRAQPLIIQPNPAFDYLNIECSNCIQNSYQIMNSHGVKIIEGKFLTPDFRICIQNLPLGVYFIRIYNEGAPVLTHTFIKI